MSHKPFQYTLVSPGIIRCIQQSPGLLKAGAGLALRDVRYHKKGWKVLTMLSPSNIDISYILLSLN